MFSSTLPRESRCHKSLLFDVQMVAIMLAGMAQLPGLIMETEDCLCINVFRDEFWHPLDMPHEAASDRAAFENQGSGHGT